MEKQTRTYQTKALEKPATEKTIKTATVNDKVPSEIRLKLWYCRQCGYVVFREDPPYICPICKAKREMFAEIVARVDMSG